MLFCCFKNHKVSFVNGTETPDNHSTHIPYIYYQITEKLREYFKKKHKVDVKHSDIKNHIMLFIDAVIVNPRYSSQTKEKLILYTDSREVKLSWVANR